MFLNKTVFFSEALKSSWGNDFKKGTLKSFSAPNKLFQGMKNSINSYFLIKNYYQRYNEVQWWGYDKIVDWQWFRTKEILNYAYDNVRFYHEKFKKSGITPDDIKTPGDILKVPLTTKHELRRAFAEGSCLAKGTVKNSFFYIHTTGSTGIPFEFVRTREEDCECRAVELRMGEWYGYHPGSRMARVWRTDSLESLVVKFWRKWVDGKTEISIFDLSNPHLSQLSDDRLKKMYEELKKFSGYIIEGYVSGLYLIAEFVLKNKLEPIRPKAIVTGGELLTPEAREVIEKAFVSKVYNRYGGSDIGLVAQECGQDNQHRLHLYIDRALIEFIKDGQPVKTGQTGEIIITDFIHRAMPFIRYQTGDLGSPEQVSSRCKCQRGLPLLNFLEGRINDVFTLSDGRIVLSHFWHKLLRAEDYMERFQIIQEKKDKVIIYFVPGIRDFDRNRLNRIKGVAEEMMPGCKVEIKEVDKISPGIGGKFRPIISNVPSGFHQVTYKKGSIN